MNPALARLSYADALFEIASAQGNVGLSTDIPTMDVRLEGMLVLAMWVGQLESISVLALVWPVLGRMNP
jgi:trk system potassium uptake protein TrkH